MVRLLHLIADSYHWRGLLGRVLNTAGAFLLVPLPPDESAPRGGTAVGSNQPLISNHCTSAARYGQATFGCSQRSLVATAGLALSALMLSATFYGSLSACSMVS
jgi:hypothetical protein